ncbi:MAG: crotonase/enoyl-CoA hydratase family protein [Acidimicrobiales bacterium]
MSATSTDPVTCTMEDGVAVVRLDDGKVNVISHQVIELVHGALDEALASGSSVAVIGREGKLSAGFDLTEMTAGPSHAAALVGAGGRLLMRIYGHPQPVVLGVTGHALAAGALLALSCDTRIGGDGPAKIGLNETAIGMGLPIFAVELARDRLSPTAFTAATIQGQVFDPAGAVVAGYLDRLVPLDQVEGQARDDAGRLAQLRRGAVSHTKGRARQRTIDHILATLAEDIAATGMPEPR